MEKQQTQEEKINEDIRNIIEEARVVLPGLQALFGFQTIAVFNERFADIATIAKVCHMLGLALVVVAIAMVMTPASYHRACGGKASAKMVKLSSFLIRGALAPLAIGLALDMFTVTYVASEQAPVSVLAGALTFLLMASLWFVLPAVQKRRLGILERG
jgi:hypothetical protein